MVQILIADPDPSFRKALTLLLSHKMGTCCISEVSDVGALIQKMIKDPPDLLLLGWSLYGTPGLETCQLLRKSHPNLKIVLMSLDPDDAAEAEAAGAAFVRKGARPEELLASLKSLLASPA